ncbi:MAG TPA: thioesterase family protein [Bacteroidota bacterium]|nr:thioesterase family protein [Bacteroidota bacterium]
MIISRTEIRVRYADTDQMRMVYYAKFFEYFEQGRSDLLRGIGLPYSRIESLGFFLPVAEAYAKYMKPARYDDLLVVTTMLKEIPAARIRIEYELRAAAGDDLHAAGYTCHSFIDAKTGKVSRAPAFFTGAVERRFHQPG